VAQQVERGCGRAGLECVTPERGGFRPRYHSVTVLEPEVVDTKGYLRAHLLLDAVRHGVQHEAKVPLALGVGAGNLAVVVRWVIIEGLAAEGAEVRGRQRAELEQARATAVRLEACQWWRDRGEGGRSQGIGESELAGRGVGGHTGVGHAGGRVSVLRGTRHHTRPLGIGVCQLVWERRLVTLCINLLWWAWLGRPLPYG
jgi:hypothetical protein